MGDQMKESEFMIRRKLYNEILKFLEGKNYEITDAKIKNHRQGTEPDTTEIFIFFKKVGDHC